LHRWKVLAIYIHVLSFYIQFRLIQINANRKMSPVKFTKSLFWSIFSINADMLFLLERILSQHSFPKEGRRGRDRMVVGFTTTCAISVFHHSSCEFEPHSLRGVLDTTLCDKVGQWRTAGRWSSPGTLVSSINKIDHYDITEILLKVELNTILPPVRRS